MAYYVKLPDNYKEGDKIVFDDNNRTASIYNRLGAITTTIPTIKVNNSQ